MNPALKSKLFCAGMVIVSGGLIIWNWYHLFQTGAYYPKVALLAPICFAIFLLFLLFPALLVQPRDKKSEAIVIVVTLAGLALGGLNWYLMI